MKRLHAYLLFVLILGMVASPLAMAQTPQEKPQRSTQVDVDRSGVHIESNAEKSHEMSAEQHGSSMSHGTVARVKDLIGLKVYSPNNEDLGKVEDLVIDPARGKISYAVLSFGGFLGMGDKYFAIPWEDIKLQSKGLTSSGTQKEDHYILNVDKESLKNAPGFSKDQWPNFVDPNWAVNIDRFYGEHRRSANVSKSAR
jgi:sporulation protein YlmC with PRC-barrel domain